MNHTTPKAVQRRDKLVDSMAKKLANGVGVEKSIFIHRKRRIKTMKWVYVAIVLSIVSTSLTWLVMTGRVAPGLVDLGEKPAALPEKGTLELLNDDLAAGKIGPDRYALYLKEYLIRYDSLPSVYKAPGLPLTSAEVYRALFGIWPQVSLRTRALLLQAMPSIERKWERFRVERQE